MTRRSCSVLCGLIAAGMSFTCAAHDPVILIPGMTAQAEAMHAMRDNFLRAGWPDNRIFMWTDSTSMTGDLAQAGVELSSKVDAVLAQTGKQKVVLITWSASTLAARWYLKYMQGAQAKTSMYFSMAAPHHGALTAYGCLIFTACWQFAPNSAFLNDLNAGTEVPGAPGVIYTTYRSPCDINDIPTSTAMLNGADNRLTPVCISHFGFPSDPALFEDIKGVIVSHEGAP